MLLGVIIMAGASVKGIKCPGCGGTVDIKAGKKVTGCQFCNSSLYIKGDPGLESFWTPFTLKAERARETVRKWFEGMNKAPELKKKAKITEVLPVFIPFYRVQTDVFGWVLGKERVDKDTYKDVEVKIEKTYDWNAPACNPGELGVEWINPAGVEFEPFDKEKAETQGMVFDIALKEEDSLKDAEKKIEHDYQNYDMTRITETRFEKVFMGNRRVSVVYYPMWVVRYSFRNRTYQMVVDGRKPEVLHGKAPGNNLYRAAMLILLIMVGCFILTSIVFGSSDSSSDNNSMVGILFAVGIMLLGYNKFRYGGLIEESAAKKNRDSLMAAEGIDLDKLLGDFTGSGGVTAGNHRHRERRRRRNGRNST